MGCNKVSETDPEICQLAKVVIDGFPEARSDMLPEISEFWDYRHGLNVSDSVVLYNDRIVVPKDLRKQVLANLHSAHQGTSGMASRALSTVFWPGLTSSIETARNSCNTCHSNSPSQARLPPIEPELPKAPFEKICADFFKLAGNYYLVVVDRLSGWPEVIQMKQKTASSGAKSLCRSLRRIFTTFGVPEEIASDGGSEFIAFESKDFYKRWGVTHRLSSAYHAQSNGWAEVAVKSIKRLLEDNVGQSGDLNTDKVVCALLQYRNTPDRECHLSPAQILFGRPLRDGIPQLKKSSMIFDNDQIREEWHDYWKSKENALRNRLVKNCEKLEANSKYLEPLREGDAVLIQNQTPNSKRSKKWDRQGTVVSTGDHDQYLVRVTGTGRLTLRNRQFLRKFQIPRDSVQPLINTSDLWKNSKPQIDSPVKKDERSSSYLSRQTVLQSNPVTTSEKARNQVSDLEMPMLPTIPNDNQVLPVMPSAAEEQQCPSSTECPTTENLPARSADGVVPLRRSTRIRHPPVFYDAHTGK